MEHAPIGKQPSSMFRTVACHGWAMMAADIVEEETQESREGTAVHWVAEQMMASYQDPNGGVPYSDQYIDKPAENGVIITDDMYDAALTYTGELIQTAQQTGLLRSINIEHRLDMPEIHEFNWGTPDAWLFDQKNMTLYMWDLKYGHASVLATENWQLMDYAVGALNQVTNNNGLQDNGITVKFCIVQPRCFDGNGPYRRWELKDVDLRGYVNQMKYACEMSDKPDAKLTAGTHCRDCPARYKCPASLNSSAVIIDESFMAIPVDVSNEGLAYELSMIERAEALIKARKNAMEAEAFKRIASGTSLPGFGVAETFTRDKWNAPAEEVFTMCDLMGVNARKPPEAKTPNQVINLLKSVNVDGSVIMSYYGKEQSGLKLIKDDGSKAKQIFSQGKL